MQGFNGTDNSKGTVRLSKLSWAFTIAAGMLAAAILIYFCVVDNINVWQSRADAGFMKVEDYDCCEIERADTPVGVIKEYTFIINEIPASDTYLAFYTVHQYVDVYVDGQPVYSLKPSENNHLSKTVGSNWTMIPVYRADVGKTVRVDITPVYESFRDREVDFLFGSRLAIYTNRMYQDLPQLILSIMAIFTGVVFLCIAGYNLLKKNRGESLATLGMFSVMMGFWRLTDTRFTPFFIPGKPVLLFYISIIMLMIGMVPLIKMVEGRVNKISRCILNTYCCLAAAICIVQLLLQIFKIMDLRENLFVTHIVIIVGVCIIIGNVAFDRIKYSGESRNRVGRKLPLICVVGVLADVVAFYVKKNSSGLLFSLLSFLLYIVFTGIATMYSYGEQEKQLAEKDRQLAEDERKLTENRINTMISQIQPHFIYNTLGSIGQLCLENPKKAANMVQEFSLYLRGNFTELDNSEPIRLSQEMEHVQHYVSIELVRFPDMRVEYDLKSSEFMLPALTIQPLVENAIKHGLMGLASGGCVTISTYETDTQYCVCVKDDGVGFDKTASVDERKHIGIKNIRGRIEAMCAGTLTVDSTPGVGTTALITIPKEK